MTQAIAAFAAFMSVLRGALFVLGVLAAAAAGIAWGVRTRRFGPFSAAGRFARRWVDPLLMPVERIVVRSGAHPSTAPWWGLVVVLVAGTLLLTGVQALAGVVLQVAWAVQHPTQLPVLVLSWAFTVLRLALIARVVVSWLSVSVRTWWVRWSYWLTEWILRPLRSVVPPFGAIDVTPVIAYFLLWLVQSMLRIP
ncbi:MAG TPA: YggT family protein [Gemmatimonadaceae bacterium]|nr:YggT family protein [Gemmatimonadaceae bacterium]